MSCLAGIDLGTSSVKVMLMREDGTPLAISHAEYDVQKPAIDRAEQEPELWWTQTVKAVREAIARAGIRGDDISCIGLSGQMHGLVALDKAGNPVCPAIIWMDQRSLQEAKRIAERASDFIGEELLNQPSSGMLVCSLLWLKTNRPELYAKTAAVMLPKDYIRYRLTGEIGVEVSDASASLAFSVKHRQWCSGLIERLDLNSALFPTVSESAAIAGTVCATAAAETGLSVKTRVVFGAGDAAAQLIGNGIVKEGVVSCNIGTSAQIAVSLNSLVYDEKKQLQTWCHGIAGRWYMQGGALTGGFALKWLKKQILRDERAYSVLDSEAERIDAGAEGLLFLPYLSGERTPVLDPLARGIYFGLSAKHTQAHLVRATMEGVIHNLQECALMLERLGVKKEKIISSGGAAKGRLWRQIQADILGMPVYTTKSEEQACLGAAILAGTGIGIYRSVEEGCSTLVKEDSACIEPIAAHTALYRERQDLFRRLYAQTKDLFPRLFAGTIQ